MYMLARREPPGSKFDNLIKFEVVEQGQGHPSPITPKPRSVQLRLERAEVVLRARIISDVQDTTNRRQSARRSNDQAADRAWLSVRR
jgi:hypothetical protein